MAKTWVAILLAAALWSGYLLGFSTRRSETVAAPNVAKTSRLDTARQDALEPTEQLKSGVTVDGELVEGPGPSGGGPGPSGGGPGPSVAISMTGTHTEAQIAFVGPEGMSVQWDVSEPGAFDSEPLVAPGRQNFAPGRVYRLKLNNIPGHEGSKLYPTIELSPATPRTEAYMAHAFIPVQFTEEDFNQVLRGNSVTMVVYLPDPEFQGLALAGVETLVSTKLDPSIDPIVEADRRGSILVVIRLGKTDDRVPCPRKSRYFNRLK